MTTTIDTRDALVTIAEMHHNRTTTTLGAEHSETQRRLRALEAARQLRDSAAERDREQPAINPVSTYLRLLNEATVQPAITKPPASTVAVPLTAQLPYLPDPVDWDDLRRDDFDDEPFLLEPLLVAGRAHSLYAPAKTGKSLLILDAVISLATGTAFLGKPAGEPVEVVYLDYEMTRADLRGRIEAMGKLDADLSHLHYYLIPALDPLDTAAGGAQIEMLAERHNASLIVIDTTARAIEGAENEADTIRALYRHTGARLKAKGITTLRVDHAGKDVEKGQRGTSAKNDDVDVVWQLTGGNDRLSLKCTHQRVGYLPQQLGLQRTQEPLGHRIVEDTWPAGTTELADRLDALNLSVYAGRPAVRMAIAEWNDANPHDRLAPPARLLEAAVRWRKMRVRQRPIDDILPAPEVPAEAA